MQQMPREGLKGLMIGSSENAFRYGNVLSCFANVCCNLCDEEAVTTTAPFFGKSWEEITPEVWDKNPSAMTFFTNEAMECYLPSLMKCASENYRDVEMAVDGVVHELAEARDECVIRWRDSRWIRIRNDRREAVLTWLAALRDNPECDRTPAAIDAARQVLERLWMY